MRPMSTVRPPLTRSMTTCHDRRLVVVSLLDVVPRAQALGLLVREVDVAFLGLALFAHHVDFVAGLEPGLALVVQNFRQTATCLPTWRQYPRPRGWA